VLNNLSEGYAKFKESHPFLKAGFLKFAFLQPKNCVLAGASGAHSVCVCTAHQAVKLMLEECKLAKSMISEYSALYILSLLGNDDVQSSSTVVFFRVYRMFWIRLNCKIYLKIYYKNMLLSSSKFPQTD
jgi:hypothetical protein